MGDELLFPLYAVHCFTCSHVERSTSPTAAHDAMERHYTARHAALIQRLVAQAVRA